MPEAKGVRDVAKKGSKSRKNHAWNKIEALWNKMEHPFCSTKRLVYEVMQKGILL